MLAQIMALPVSEEERKFTRLRNEADHAIVNLKNLADAYFAQTRDADKYAIMLIEVADADQTLNHLFNDRRHHEIQSVFEQINRFAQAVGILLLKGKNA